MILELKASNVCDYDQIVFHSLPGRFRKRLLRNIPPGIKITWIFYGYEYYHRRETIEKFLKPKTLKYYNSQQNPNFLRLKFQKFLDRIRRETKQYKVDLERVNQFAHWNPTEYKLIRDQYQLTQMDYLPFSIGWKIHELVPDHNHRYLLLGHSGAITVNHLDGIDALDQQFVDGFDRILIPFSYGASKAYEKKVRKVAEEKIGSKALFLTRFMNRSSYFNLLSRAKVAWMPQLRGMGGGNILFCLKNNIPVIFWVDSVMYKYYTNLGFYVFSSNDLGSTTIELTKDQKELNQSKLLQHFGPETLQNQYHKLLSN